MRSQAIALCALAAIACCSGVASRRAHAQRGERWRPEARLETIVDPIRGAASAWHAALGANVVAGTYARIGLLAAGGVRRVRHEMRASGRFDVAARFHVDPLREYAWGVYTGAGASLLFDGGLRPRARALLIVGAEGPEWSSRWTPGIEIGLGGGVRIAATIVGGRRRGR